MAYRIHAKGAAMRDFFRRQRRRNVQIMALIVLAMVVLIGGSQVTRHPLNVPIGRAVWDLVRQAWARIFRIEEHPGYGIQPRRDAFSQPRNVPADAMYPENGSQASEKSN